MFQEICKSIIKAGGRPLIVGGYVRDKLMGLEPKDLDIEVYGLSAAALTSILSAYGSVNAVGMSFGVLKLHCKQDNQWYDFSLPRRESKQGRGHKGFIVEADPDMTPMEAAGRRDFTINALAMDPITGEVFDFYNGDTHLMMRILDPTTEAFMEDPLRVLRAMQFAARFKMNASARLIRFSQSMKEEYNSLAVERVWGEWQKLCEKGKRPSYGLIFLVESGWIDHYPELKALIGVKQDPEWHPEGDAWIHNCYVVDAAAEIADREKLSPEDRTVLILSAICHDLGKAVSTVFERGRWRSPGHAEAGVPLAESFLKRIGCPINIIERVKPLVRWHMIVAGQEATKRMARRLSVQIQPSSVAELLLLIEADASGRPPLPKGLPEQAKRLIELANEVGVVEKKLLGFIRGQDLLDRGMKPGPAVGAIVKEAYEAQIEGVFDNPDDAKKWLDNRMKSVIL